MRFNARLLSPAVLAGALAAPLLLAPTAHAAAPAAAPAAASSVSARAAAYVDCDKYWSTTSALRVRTGPGTGYTTIGQLGYHNTVDIIDMNASGTWDEVRLLTKSTYGLTAGTVGWVSDAYLQIDNPCRTSINV